MRFKTGIIAGLAFAGLAVMTPSALAQSSNDTGLTGIFSAEQASTFSKEIERDLAEQGARVALVFRTGRERSQLPDGINFTHGALWIYQDIAKADGTQMKGYVTYNLFHGDGETLPKTQSYITDKFPYDFVAPMATYDVGVIVPTPEMQRRLYTQFADGTFEDLHIPAYSLISNVSDAELQNCNEFLLDNIAAAAWETSDYKQIKLNLDAHFKPTRIKVGGLKRLFAPMADERVKTRDHGRKIETATYASIAQFMQTNRLSDASYRLQYDPAPQIAPMRLASAP